MHDVFTDLEESKTLPGSRSLLIGTWTDELEKKNIGAHLDELEQLCDNLDISAAEKIPVHLRQTHPGTLLGSGKTEELAQLIHTEEINLAVFDNALSPAQQRNLERIWDIPVIDRREVILEIFAQRATTREAVLQVALARLEYSLPRLTRAWTHLSRQRGGAKGTRGKGETQLESDRRRVQDKIARYKKELAQIKQIREIRRKKRNSIPIPTAALVGYTNAGKSSLLNALSGADLLAEDRLFATLDPASRKIALPGGQEVILTDTVGFVRKLPHSLVEAFHSTLEEAVSADVVIEVIDISHDDWQEQSATTENVLSEMGEANYGIIKVFNKIDSSKGQNNLQMGHILVPDAVPLSAKTGEGLDTLLDELSSALMNGKMKVELAIPYSRGDILAYLHRTYAFLDKQENEENVTIALNIEERDRKMLTPFIQK